MNTNPHLSLALCFTEVFPASWVQVTGEGMDPHNSVRTGFLNCKSCVYRSSVEYKSQISGLMLHCMHLSSFLYECMHSAPLNGMSQLLSAQFVHVAIVHQNSFCINELSLSIKKCL